MSKVDMPDPTRASITALYQATIYIFDTTRLPYAHPSTTMQKANVLVIFTGAWTLEI